MITEILLIVPFSNVKFERMFSRVVRVRTDWHNQRNRRNLDAFLQISEEGPQINKFNASESTDHWFNDQVGRLSFKNHRYPEKRQRLKNSSLFHNVMLALQHLEEDKSRRFEEFLRNFFLKFHLGSFLRIFPFISKLVFISFSLFFKKGL